MQSEELTPELRFMLLALHARISELLGLPELGDVVLNESNGFCAHPEDQRVDVSAMGSPFTFFCKLCGSNLVATAQGG